jgi:DNA-binding CsgD family transcriptional regulator
MATTAASDAITTQDAAERLRRVHSVWLNLPREPTLQDIIFGAPHMVCQALDLDRALIAHVRGEHIAFAAGANLVEPRRDLPFARIARTMRARLVDAPPELEVVTTQRALRVRNAGAPGASVLRDAVALLDTPEYLVAPIVHSGRVVGLIAADRYHSGEPLTELDLELFFVFASGLGWAMRDATVAHYYAIEAGLATSPGDFIETQLAGLVHELASVPGGWALAEDPPENNNALGQLTPREREVLVLLASGASNQQIAEALVLGESTVKTHVRGVLRKLEVANRTEAVARYHALSR